MPKRRIAGPHTSLPVRTTPPALWQTPLPTNPANILKPDERPRRSRTGVFGAVLIAVTIIGGLELVQPGGFSPFRTVGKAWGNMLEPIRQSERAADLCYLEQERLAQRLAEAEQEYADTLGQCSYLGLGDIIVPGAGSQAQAECEQTIQERYETTLQLLHRARDLSKQCRL